MIEDTFARIPVVTIIRLLQNWVYGIRSSIFNNIRGYFTSI